MLSRRDFLQIAVATAVLTGRNGRALAQRRISESDLLDFKSKGRLTLLHIADTHAQLRPAYFREPSTNIGVGEMAGLPPHLTGAEALAHYGVAAGSAAAYGLSASDFVELAGTYGRVGGMDRVARVIDAIRSERGADRTLVLDGGDALQGSYTALASRGADMIQVFAAMGIEATTGHWEFTLGEERIRALFGDKGGRGSAKIDFLAGNIVETDFEEPVFKSHALYERAGVRIGVIGQAFPYTPVANPRWMMPNWSFGVREQLLRRRVAAIRAAGASIVVLLSHNGFDVDRKLAGRVSGIDVILTAHTHDALPAPVKVGQTLLIASGAHGKFVSRLDLDVRDGRIHDYGYALIPVITDAIEPHPDVARLIQDIRAPHQALLGTELARTRSLLYRRDNISGSLDDLICQAVLEQRDAEICFSPGFRWGPTLLPDQAITWEDICNATAITYPACYRTSMTGAAIKDILEDVADNLFNPDPYYQQGGDMVRAGGLSFTLYVDQRIGSRIHDLRSTRTGAPIEAGRSYVVAGWASVNEGASGPPIWEVLVRHLARHPVVEVAPNTAVRVVRG